MLGVTYHGREGNKFCKRLLQNVGDNVHVDLHDAA